MAEQPQRQPPQRVVYRSVTAGELRQFRLDNPEARQTAWPNDTNGPLVYGFYAPVVDTPTEQ